MTHMSMKAAGAAAAPAGGAQDGGASADPQFHPGVAYRPDIDGLRAIAVLSVVLFHAGLPGFSGGFVGVDVFFVISGFLITKIIVSDIEKKQFTIGGFYRRRIKRIVPAFFVVALATATVGYFISVPGQLADLGKSLVASGVAATNILFWQQTGYFAGASEIKPLLHTWSLSVEEQFYFIFPLILMVAARLGRGAARTITIVIFLVSLASSQLLLSAAPTSTFFLLHSRAWELMAGSILALDPRLVRQRAHSGWLVAAGIALILAAPVFYTPATPFPGVAALLPVAGSVLVIAGGGHGDPVSERFLGSRPMVAIGRISYSLYLWHWPLFAFWRYWTSAEPTLAEALGLIALAFLLSAISYRFVEQPFRTRTALKGMWPFLFAAAAAATLIGIGFTYFRSGGLPQRFPPAVQQLLSPETLRGPSRWECLGNPDAWRSPAEPCVYGAPVRPSVALWGDSHAYALIESLGQDLAARRQSAAFLGYTACPPIVGAGYDEAANRCSEYGAGALRYLLDHPEIRTVVIFARHAFYIHGGTEAYGPAEAGADEASLRFAPVPGTRGAPAEAAYEDRLVRAVRRLREAGKRVVMVLPVPEVPFDAPSKVALSLIRGDEGRTFTVPRSMYRERQRHVLPMLDRLARSDGVTLVGLTDLLCDAERCRIMAGDRLLYADDDHLTAYGAGLLSKRVVRLLAEPPASDGRRPG